MPTWVSMLRVSWTQDGVLAGSVRCSCHARRFRIRSPSRRLSDPCTHMQILAPADPWASSGDRLCLCACMFLSRSGRAKTEIVSFPRLAIMLVAGASPYVSARDNVRSRCAENSKYAAQNKNCGYSAAPRGWSTCHFEIRWAVHAPGVQGYHPIVFRTAVRLERRELGSTWESSGHLHGDPVSAVCKTR